MRECMHRERDRFYSDEFEFYIDRRSCPLAEHDPKVHWHDYCELEFITEGTGTHRLNDQEKKIGAGHVYLLTPMDFHRLTCTDSEALRLVHLQFDTSALNPETVRRISVLRERLPSGLAARLTPAQHMMFAPLLEQLLDEFRSRRTDGVALMRCLLEQVCILFLRIVERQAPSVPPGAYTDAENTAVNRAIQIVQYDFRRSLTLREVAQTVHLSTNYFGALFRAHMGVSFGEYLQRHRLGYARQLLSDTRLSISEIARESGFPSASHFTEIFRRRFRVTPTEYRRNHSNESEA